MVNYLHNRLKSERGASISFALFLALVCAAVASIVLAAATASSGAFAKVGKSDKDYYSVISAAGLFRDALESNGEKTYQIVVEKNIEDVDAVDARTSEDEDLDFQSDSFEGFTFKSVKQLNSTSGEYVDPTGFTYLVDATEFLVFGAKQTTPDSAVNTGTKANPKSYTFEVNPGESDPTTTVRARLHEDGLLELVFYNDEDGFSLFMSLQGQLEEESVVNTNLGATSPIDGGQAENKLTGKMQRIFGVTWRLVQLTPGKGFIND